MNITSYKTRSYSGVRFDDGAHGADDVDDDPDDARHDDDDDDGDDSPIRERIFSTDFCLPESFLLSIFFPPRRSGVKPI